MAIQPLNVVSQCLAHPRPVGVGSVGDRITQNTILNLPKSGEPINIGGCPFGDSKTAIGRINDSATLAVNPSAGNLLGELGVLTAASCQQQTQSYDYGREFHNALDAA